MGLTFRRSPAPRFAQASANGSQSSVGGHLAFQSGLDNRSSPALAQFIAVSVAYITNVPLVSYPQFTGTIADGAAMNHAAQLSHSGQSSIGITAGFNFRF